MADVHRNIKYTSTTMSTAPGRNRNIYKTLKITKLQLLLQKWKINLYKKDTGTGVLHRFGNRNIWVKVETSTHKNKIKTKVK